MKGAKTVLTLFGSIEVRRHVYQESRGGRCLIPMDEQWGVRGHTACPRVREVCLHSSAMMTPGELVRTLSMSSMFCPSETAVRNMLGKYADAMNREGLGDKIMQELVCGAEAEPATKVFVASMDGTTVPVRQGGGEAGQAPGNLRESEGEEPLPGRFRMAMVGALGCYDIEEVFDGKAGQSVREPVRLSGDYFARMPESGCADFKSEFEFRCFETTAKLPEKVVKILLMDAAKWQWNHVLGDEQFDDYEKLIDYWHVCEHLASAAEHLFGDDKKSRKRWRKHWRRKLKRESGAVAALLRSMLRYLNERPLTTKAREQVQKQMNYFTNHAHMMDYARFRRNGWPIGSGPVEAACKTLVKERMCRSGMRWTNEGGQTILDIRSLIKSNRWETFWEHAKNAA